MYENFKTDFALNLTGSEFSPEQIQVIMSTLDKSMYNYEVKERQTGIVLYNDELPEMVKRFLIAKKMEGFSDGTLENYRGFLQKFFFKVKKAPEQIETDDIIWYLYW